MRKKKLDVVFAENVVDKAESILSIVNADINEKGLDHKVSKSVVLRVAMHIGLISLMDELNDIKADGGNISGYLKVKDIRASLGFEK